MHLILTSGLKSDSSPYCITYEALLNQLDASPMRISYKCTEPYDGGSFDKYPERRGWEVSLDKINSSTSFRGKDSKEVESFFQCWLFFGTLHCFFALVGIEVHDAEFVATENGAEYVTFGKLFEKVELWSDKLRNIPDAQRDSGAVEATQCILSKVICFVEQFGEVVRPEPRLKSNKARRKKRERGFSDDIALSIVTLASLLMYSGRLVLSEESWPSVDLTVPLLQERFDEMGWCKYDILRLFRELGTDGYYYMALQPSPNRERNHANCDDRHCQARNIDEANYVTRHMLNCDGKDDMGHLQVDNFVKTLVKIVDEDGIPVVTLEKIDDSAAPIKVRNAATGLIPFVAVSHV